MLTDATSTIIVTSGVLTRKAFASGIFDSGVFSQASVSRVANRDATIPVSETVSAVARRVANASATLASTTALAAFVNTKLDTGNVSTVSNLTAAIIHLGQGAFNGGNFDSSNFETYVVLPNSYQTAFAILHSTSSVAAFANNMGDGTWFARLDGSSALSVTYDVYTSLYPVADLGEYWTTETGATTNLYASIDELVPDENDYIVSPPVSLLTQSTQAFSLRPVDPPTRKADFSVSYEYYLRDGSGQNLTIKLMQNTTVIASWSHVVNSLSPVAHTQPLTTAQINAITDYSALRLEFVAGG